MSKPSWQDVARQVQDHRTNTIAEVQPQIPDVPKNLPSNVTSIPRDLLSSREVEITESTTEILVASLATGKLTSREVTNAFLRRAGLAQKLVNCITELLPQRALARADELDKYLAQHKKPLGPLHGLPISVKEHIGMKDLGYNAGFVAWEGKTAPDNALILNILLKAGCVFYARTTEPQTLMHLETSSNLYGVTFNPFNHSLTAGGSSGGEGALIGLRGSCLGIGSDIGGSIRSPAANQGLYGFRPSTFRLPTGGSLAPNLGSGHINGVVGPLSTSLQGVKLFMEIVLAYKPWIQDPTLIPLAWREENLNLSPAGDKKLKIGILWSDGIVKPHPPIQRGLQETANKLKSVKGIEVVEWTPYKHDLAWEIIASLYYPDAGTETSEIIDASGEPWRPLSKFIVTDNPYSKPRTVGEIRELYKRMEGYRLEYIQKWNSTAVRTGKNGEIEDAVDVILCPAGPGAAPLLDCSRYWGYTSQWNLLDYPALVFPVTMVDPAIDVWDEKYVAMNEQDQYNHDLYRDPEKYRGAPVSLQLVGRRYEDEKVIEALEYIQEKIGLPFTKFT